MKLVTIVSVVFAILFCCGCSLLHYRGSCYAPAAESAAKNDSLKINAYREAATQSVDEKLFPAFKNDIHSIKK